MKAINWVKAWRDADVPEHIVREFYRRYGVPPIKVTKAVLSDDRRIGIGPLSLPYSNPEVVSHDLEMLLDALGYPVTGIAETQGRFVGGTLLRGVKGLGFAGAAIPIAVIGGTVGAAIMILREVLK